MSKRKYQSWEEAETTALKKGEKIFYIKEADSKISVYVKKKIIFPLIIKFKWHKVNYKYSCSNHRYERDSIFLKYWQKMLLTIISIVIGYLTINWNHHATVGSYLLGIFISLLIPILTYKITFQPVKKADKYVKKIIK